MTCLTVADRRSSCESERLALAERPKYALLRLLGELGVEKVGLNVYADSARFSLDPFQELALRVLVWGDDLALRPGSGYKCIRAEEVLGRRFEVYVKGGNERVEAILEKGKFRWKQHLLSMLSLKPIIAIDLSLVWRHTPKELVSLRKQIAASLGVLRQYLWDRHLLLSSLRPGVYEWIRLLAGRGGPLTTSLPADEAARILDAKKIILLDPNAEKPLTRRDVLEADAFILGGIVDRTPRPGETGRIRLAGYAEPRRILFHGDIHGVPNRLNMLIEILLRARYVYCGDIDEAVRSVMSRRDIILRAMVELSRWSRGKRRRVPLEVYDELRKWLPISFKDFVIAAKKLGLEVEGVQQRPNSSRRNPR